MEENNFMRALAECMREEYAEYAVAVEDHAFSPKFERKVRKLINRRRKPYFRMINTVGKRVACIALAVFIATATTVMSVSAFRKAFIHFFSNLLGTYSDVVIETDKQHPVTIEDAYEITYDLSDYRIDFEDNCELYRDKIYINGNNAVYFQQHTQGSFNGINLNTEKAEIIDTEINGYPATFYYDINNAPHFIWDNGEYIFYLWSNLSKEEMLEIAKSVRKSE